MANQSLRLPLIAIGLFNVVDYYLSLRCLAQGFFEGNPLMRPVVNTEWFFVIKVLLIPLALYLIWRCRHRIGRIATSSIWSAACVYATLMGYYALLFASGLAR